MKHQLAIEMSITPRTVYRYNYIRKAGFVVSP